MKFSLFLDKPILSKLLIYGLILFFPIISLMPAKGQAPAGEIDYEYITPREDTVVINRRAGDYWFGFMAGPNFQYYFNDLKIPTNPLRPSDETNPLMNFPNGGGSGLHIGFMVEYLPPLKHWAGALKVYFYDYRTSQTEFDPPHLDTLDLKYQAIMSFTHLSISPSVRYNLGIEGLHAFGGLDLEFSIGNDSRLRHTFVNSGDILQDWKLPLSDINTRLGLHLGGGWDIYIADINNRIRVNLTPYISIHTGTSILSDFNSSWNAVTFRAGMAIKFGPDIIREDTLFFNPDYVAPEEILASLDEERDVNFPGFERKEPIAAVINIPPPDVMIAGEVAEKPELPAEEAEPGEEIALETNKTERFPYQRPSDTELYSDLEVYLDKVAETVKSNPSFEVRIVGYSDNSGTTAQNFSRSRERAQKVKDYLVSKGIPRRRILSTGRGATQPIARNDTEEGRQKNRRVEIVVVEN